MYVERSKIKTITIQMCKKSVDWYASQCVNFIWWPYIPIYNHTLLWTKQKLLFCFHPEWRGCVLVKPIDDLVLSSDGGYYLGISGGFLVSCCLLYSKSATVFNMIQTMNSDISRGKLKERVRLIIMLLFLRHRSLLKNTSGNHVCLFTKAYFVLPNRIRIIQQSCESWCSVLCFYESQKSLLKNS